MMHDWRGTPLWMMRILLMHRSAAVRCAAINFFFFFFGQVENIVPPSHIIYIRKLFKLYFWSGAGHFIYFVPFHLLYFFFLFKDAQIESENRICVLPSYGIWRDRSDGSNRLVQKRKREREREILLLLQIDLTSILFLPPSLSQFLWFISDIVNTVGGFTNRVGWGGRERKSKDCRNTIDSLIALLYTHTLGSISRNINSKCGCRVWQKRLSSIS